MRVCIIGNLPPVLGGVTTSTLSLARHLKQAGIDVSVAGFSPDPAAARAMLGSFGISRVLVIDPRCLKLAFLPFLVFRVFFFLLLHRPHLVHSLRVYPKGFLALAAARLCGLPVVVSSSGSDILGFRSMKQTQRILSRLVLSASDALTVPSAQLARLLSFYSSKLTIVPTGVDLQAYSFSGRKRDLARIIYAGRLVRSKGVFDLLDIIGQLPGDPSFRVVGDGPDKDEFMRSARAKGLDVGLSSPGVCSLKDELAGSSILLLASRSEGLPNVLLEAMACGCIVVARPAGGVVDVISDGKNGFLADTQPDFVKTLSKILSDPSLFEGVRANALSSVKGFSMRDIARRYMRGYAKLVL